MERTRKCLSSQRRRRGERLEARERNRKIAEDRGSGRERKNGERDCRRRGKWRRKGEEEKVLVTKKFPS